jgi:hypothetical protein
MPGYTVGASSKPCRPPQMIVQSASYQLAVSCVVVLDKDVAVSAIPLVGATLTNQTDQC